MLFETMLIGGSLYVCVCHIPTTSVGDVLETLSFLQVPRFDAQSLYVLLGHSH